MTLIIVWCCCCHRYWSNKKKTLEAASNADVEKISYADFEKDSKKSIDRQRSLSASKYALNDDSVNSVPSGSSFD